MSDEQIGQGQTHLCLPQCSDDLLRSVSLPSHPDLLAEKLQTRSILTLHLVSFQGVRSVDPDGHRRLLAITLGPEESEDGWSEILEQLLERGLSGVELVIADEHAGLAAALRRFLPEVRRQPSAESFLEPTSSEGYRFRGRFHQQPGTPRTDRPHRSAKGPSATRSVTRRRNLLPETPPPDIAIS